MLLNLKELDTLVVLTKEQKDDIIKQFGDYNNIKVIPNAISFEENLTQNIREKKFYYCITKICSYEKYHTYHFRYKYCKKKSKGC